MSHSLDSLLTIEADTDDVGEDDNAQIRLVQDGGNSIGRFGFRDDSNNLELVNEAGGGASGVILGTGGVDRLVLESDGDLAVDGSTLFVDESSNEVGIGTSSPSAKLDVVGSLEVDGDTLWVDSNNDRVGLGTKDSVDFSDPSGSRNVVAVVREPNAPALRVYANDNKTSSLQLFEKGSSSKPYGFEFLYSGNEDKLHLWSRSFSGNEAIRMTWEKDGDIGIGTTTPLYELDVDGSVRVDTLRFSSDASALTTAPIMSGQAQYHGSPSSPVYLGSPGWSNLASQTIDCPQSGYVLAIGSCAAWAVNSGSASAHGAQFSLSTSSGAQGLKVIDWSDNLPASSSQNVPISLQYVFTVPAGGDRTFYLTGVEQNGDVRVRNSTLSLVYIPLAY